MDISYKQRLSELKINLTTFNKSQEIIPGNMFKDLFTIKEKAVNNEDQQAAKQAWCLEQVGNIHNTFCMAFTEIKNEKYLNAWHLFERCEIDLHFLTRHFQNSFLDFNLDFIDEYVAKWQSLFPYKYFFSPGYIKKNKKCSICGKKISFRNHCGHEPGEVYNGRMCSRIVEDAEVLEVSLVTNPTQKYSVILFSDHETGEVKDNYDYRIIAYVINYLESPFHGWEYRETKKVHPHSNFKHISKDEDCPCGSKEKYEACCLKKSGVELPHYQFIFEHVPRNEFSEIIYYKL